MTHPDPDIPTFDHAGVSVADLDRSIEFYRLVLGFDRVEHRFELPQHDMRGAVLLNPAGVRIELFERAGSEPARRGGPAESARQQGWFQFALHVRDVRAAFERMVAGGASAVMAPGLAPDGRTIFAFIGDPDGHLIEIVHRNPRP